MSRIARPRPTQAPSWRDTLKIHPAAAVFDPLSDDELRALGEDIIKNGLKLPIVLWCAHPKGEPLLLDGCNRLDAIELVTRKTVEVGAPSLMAGDFLATDKVIVLDKSVDPYAYVESVNLNRRHLSAERKRELIAKLLKATPEKSNRQIAERAKVDHKTVGAVRVGLEGRGEIPHADNRRDTKGRKQPSRKLTPKKLTTQQYVSHAVRVQAHMDAGEIEKLQTENAELRSKLAKVEAELAKVKAELDEIIAAQADDGAMPPAAGDTPDELPLPPFPWRAAAHHG